MFERARAIFNIEQQRQLKADEDVPAGQLASQLAAQHAALDAQVRSDYITHADRAQLKKDRDFCKARWDAANARIRKQMRE